MHKTPPDGSREKILPRVGWREWVSLPDLPIDSIKAKVDTGAHNSSLHARDLEFFTRQVQGPGGLREREFVRFATDPNHPGASGKRKAGQAPAPDAAVVTAEALVLDRRAVRSSSGESEVRPVISTRLRIGEYEFPIELNLTDREMMGFRLLIGRQSIHGRFWVDPSASYLIGR
ncbi:MAG: RimK/LysX family protein [bacterium]|nr:RimK/LysX family protein [bacterium]